MTALRENEGGDFLSPVSYTLAHIFLLYKRARDEYLFPCVFLAEVVALVIPLRQSLEAERFSFVKLFIVEIYSTTAVSKTRSQAGVAGGV